MMVAVCAALGLWLGACDALAAFVASSAPRTDDEGVWAYTDDRGRIVHVEHYRDVPERLRPYAQRIDRERTTPDPRPSLLIGLLALDEADSAREPGAVYTYRGPSGRAVYTNVLENVPLEQRARARLDLSRLSLNTPLGADLDAALAARYQTLQSSPQCQAAKRELDEPLWQRTWREHRALVVGAGALLLLAVLTRRLLRAGYGAAWMRALNTAIPLFVLVGCVAYALNQSNRALEHIRARAEPCVRPGWSSASEPAAAGVVGQHMRLVRKLQDDVKSLDHAGG
jgi:hypothetical protein